MKKIEKIKYTWKQKGTFSTVSHEQVSVLEEIIIDKLNEIIDVINEEIG